MLYPKKHNNIWEFPVHHMRGGTSTGLVIWEDIAPRQTELREELLRQPRSDGIEPLPRNPVVCKWRADYLAWTFGVGTGAERVIDLRQAGEIA